MTDSLTSKELITRLSRLSEELPDDQRWVPAYVTETAASALSELDRQRAEIERLQRELAAANDLIAHAIGDSDGRGAHETPTKPQTPIARIFVADHSSVGAGNKIVGGTLYAPGLPPGDHDLYCEPVALAPMTRDETECSSCAAGINSFTDPETGRRLHARNGAVTVCSAQTAEVPALDTATSLTDSECDDVIAFLEDYEWTGLTRENVRTWCTAIAEARSPVKAEAFPGDVPADHRAGTEPLSRVIADLEMAISPDLSRSVAERFEIVEKVLRQLKSAQNG